MKAQDFLPATDKRAHRPNVLVRNNPLHMLLPGEPASGQCVRMQCTKSSPRLFARSFAAGRKKMCVWLPVENEKFSCSSILSGRLVRRNEFFCERPEVEEVYYSLFQRRLHYFWMINMIQGL